MLSRLIELTLSNRFPGAGWYTADGSRRPECGVASADRRRARYDQRPGDCHHGRRVPLTS